MTDYTKTTNFATKDSLPSGNPAKIVKGTEIDTEFNNVATAVATKANKASPTFTGTATFADLKGATGATITTFLDEDTMSSDSATAVPTQQSVKAYVDTQLTASDLDFQADTGGALSIDLDSETLTLTGGTGVDTSGSANTVTFAIDSTVATLTDTQALSNKTINTASNTITVVEADISDLGTTVVLDSDIGSTVQAYSAVLAGTTASFTTADETKLDGIETSATADQTGAEIKTAYEAESDTNAYTDAEKTKLSGIDAGAEVNDATTVLDADIGVTVQGYSSVLAATTASFTTAEESKLSGIDAGAEVNDATTLLDADIGSTVLAFDSNLQSFVTALNLPTADGTSGQALLTNGSGVIAFGNVDALPSQTGKSGYYLTTNGTTASWGVVSIPSYTYVRTNFTATAAQTTFTVAYTVGYVDVYMNGVKLIVGTDVTATNGTSIVLASGAAVGDLIEVVAFETFNVANALTNTDIGVSVQAYDADTTKNDVANTFTANQTFDNGIIEEYNATGTSGAVTIDLDTGNNFSTAMAGATTYTFSNPATSGKVSAFTLKVVNNGSAIIWPAAVDWPSATAPTLSASGATDVFVFYTHDNGTTWYGFTAGQGMA